MDRYWSKVDASGECWLWTARISTNGYGQAYDGERLRQAHHVAYERLVGPLPDGLEADHLCKVRNCVNPDHLEFVTHAENVRRSSSRHVCLRGHRLIPGNLYRGMCRECRRIRKKEAHTNG